MKSVRLDARTEARLREAARLARVPESRIIREAIAKRTDAILSSRLDVQLADLIGVVRSKGGRARRAHEAYTELLKESARSRRGRRAKSPS
jgi:hypothetical protein